jgi:parvulin-like peptidyl-prolyl isomerase
MGWHRLGTSALVVLVFAGCGREAATLAAGGPGPVAPPDPGPTVTRMQQPEAAGPKGPIQPTVFEAVHESFPGLADSRVAVRIRAQVNGVPILDEEVKDACYPALIATLNLPEPERSTQQAAIYRQQLEELINRELILQDAFARLTKSGQQYLDKLKTAAGKEFDRVVRSMKTRAGAKTDEELKDFLRTHGQSLEGIRRQVERNFMAREYMRSRIYPAIERIGHQQIQEYYQDHAAEFQTVDSVQWQDVFIDAAKYPSREAARQFAEQLAARARGGQDFAELAKYDNGDSSYRNGEGNGHRHGEIQPAQAEPLLFQMRDGDVGPLVELPTGFHIIRLVKRTNAGQLPLDEKTQVEVRRKLQAEAAERETKRLLAELRQKASVEIAGNTP